MEVWPVQHAKARFSELLDACQREGPQVVSRHGIETAVLVSIEEWRRVQARSDRHGVIEEGKEGVAADSGAPH